MGWLWMTLLGWGCTGSSPETVTTWILDGDLNRATEHLLRLDEGDPFVEWKPIAMRLKALQPQRAAIQAAERRMLGEAARNALDNGDPAGALGPIRAGLRSDPGDAAFQALFAELTAAAERAAPADAAPIYAALAEIMPTQAETYHTRHAQALQAARYHPDQRAQTRAAQAGITFSAAAHLLEKLDREYRVVPDWSAVAAGGRAHLAHLAETDARDAWPTLSTITWPGDPAQTVTQTQAQLQRAVWVGEAANLPAEMVIAEWMTGALGALDTWTRAVWPAEIASWQAHHEGVRYGAGVELMEVGGDVVIKRPLVGTAAWDSGLHQGDRLDRIQDGDRSVALSSLPAGSRRATAEAMLSGDAGTTVHIAVSRAGTPTPLSFDLVRGPVKTETLQGYAREPDNAWRLWLGEGLAYVRVLSFRDYTEPDFDALLENDVDAVQGVVLDLRGNPGGDVNAAVQIADRFIAAGLLAELSGRVEPETTTATDPEVELVPWNQAIPGHALEDIPVVVVVDQDTASAAEILAGSLQERANAVVIGAPTWGKGFAQALRVEAEQGYAVQFTNQVWTLPSGRQLAHRLGGGIQPDVRLALSPGEQFQANRQAQQRTALHVHADGTPMKSLETEARADLPELPEDPVLIASELVLRALIHKNTQAP